MTVVNPLFSDQEVSISDEGRAHSVHSSPNSPPHSTYSPSRWYCICIYSIESLYINKFVCVIASHNNIFYVTSIHLTRRFSEIWEWLTVRDNRGLRHPSNGGVFKFYEIYFQLFLNVSRLVPLEIDNGNFLMLTGGMVEVYNYRKEEIHRTK